MMHLKSYPTPSGIVYLSTMNDVYGCLYLGSIIYHSVAMTVEVSRGDSAMTDVIHGDDHAQSTGNINFYKLAKLQVNWLMGP